LKPIKRLRRVGDPPEAGDMVLLPNPKLSWLAGGFIVFCGSCFRRLSPVPMSQEPDECCDCDRTLRYLPALVKDNRAGTQREATVHLVWDTEAENAIMDANQKLTVFTTLEEAKKTAGGMNKK
jgi:hypothetical protein